jgi:hypothetical protein
MAEKSPKAPMIVHHRAFQLDLLSVYSSKSSALDPEEGPGTEKQSEVRLSTRARYGIGKRLSATLLVPVALKRNSAYINTETTRQNSTGFGDAELSAVWTTDLSRTVSGSGTLAIAGAVKVPTGHNDEVDNGERLDEHLQSGTGTYDWQTGVGLARPGGLLTLTTSAYYRGKGTNSHGYHYGNLVLLNAGVQRQMNSTIAASLQVNGRIARRDSESEVAVPNTGGTVVYLSPGAKVQFEGIGFWVNIQVPVYRHLFDDQSENAVLTTGLSFGAH